MSLDYNLYMGSYLLIQTELNLHDFMKEKFNDGDLFARVELRGIKGQILIPNRRDTTGYGGIRVKETGCYDYPKDDFSHKDWAKLIKVLSEESIAFQKCSGLLYWIF